MKRFILILAAVVLSMNALQAQGWFAGNSGTCSFFFDGSNDNGGILSEMGDVICYHSHVKTTLTS